MNRNLQPRDKFLGIKKLQQQYTPKMYEGSHWNDEKKLWSKEEQAEQTAILFEQKNKTVRDFLHEGDEFELHYFIQEDDEKYYIRNPEIEENSTWGKSHLKKLKRPSKQWQTTKLGDQIDATRKC